MKKILFLLHYPPPIHGSAMVGQTIKNSNIITSNFESKFINISTSHTIEEIEKKSISKFYRYFSIATKLFWLLISFRPNLCYISLTSSGPGFYKDFPLTLLVSLFNTKKVYHFHNKGVKQNQIFFFNDLFYRITFKRAHVILLSKSLYIDIDKYVTNDKVKYCANGIRDLDKKEFINTNRSDTDIQSVKMLFLSNLIISKGIFVLLEACKILRDKNISFSLIIIGGNGDINSLILNEKIKELGLLNKVKYAGKFYGAEKEIYWNQSDIFVHPTFSDCFPLVLLEAMQHSLPVVSTFEGGIPDVVEDGVTGFLVPQRDAVALADKLEILIRNPELRKQMGEAGRKKYEEEFTLERFENRLVEILKSVISS